MNPFHIFVIAIVLLLCGVVVASNDAVVVVTKTDNEPSFLPPTVTSYIKSDGFKSHLPSNDPFVEKTVEKCAVVGGSASLKGQYYGAQIDSMDHVYRVNFNPVLKQYKNDVGKKTTHWFLDHHVTIQSEKDGNYDLNKDKTIIIQAQVLNYFQLFERVQSQNPNVYVLGRILGGVAWNVANHFAIQQDNAQVASTGLVAVLAALVQCKDVHVYGFGDVPGLGRYWQSVGERSQALSLEKKTEYAIEEFFVRWMANAAKDDLVDGVLSQAFEKDKHLLPYISAKRVVFHHSDDVTRVCFKKFISQSELHGDALATQILNRPCGSQPTLSIYGTTRAPGATLNWGNHEGNKVAPTPQVRISQLHTRAPTPMLTRVSPTPANWRDLPDEEKPIRNVGHVDNSYPPCDKGADTARLMAKSLCDASAAPCLKHAATLDVLCNCYESWDYCYKGIKCGWTPVIGCQGLESQGTECIPYNCWTGKILDENGKDEGDYVSSINKLNTDSKSTGKHSRNAWGELQLVAFLLVIAMVAFLTVRYLRKKGIITQNWRWDWQKLTQNKATNESLNA
mmetsp:Transcript_10662/g.17792  ORF Transcript_10662/g.17792 Transcript_10662/m.17792 type:complete len:564 (+) Transcript_10662:22-1713(+)